MCTECEVPIQMNVKNDLQNEEAIPRRKSDPITPEDVLQQKKSLKSGADEEVLHEDPETVLFDLIISEDRTEAYLHPRIEIPDTLTVEALKDFIKKEGISYGLVDDQQFDEYLTQETFKGETWLIAKGLPPNPGKSAQIIYHFDQDPLEIGTIKAGGVIDFKEKGKIVQVEEGILMAEKIPLVKEKPGMDVYGKVLHGPRAQDITLLPRENTEVSRDGLKVFAKKAGRPVLLADGRLSVSPELEIKGDVNLETGHIQFNGFINVRGTIQEGFRVKGRGVAAKEIYKAEVEVDGDIVVEGGIIGSRLISRGNVKAKYIQSSIIETLGDLIVEEAVIHSRLETQGSLITHSLLGKVISSDIIAKQGIEANIIGSDSSKPCTLMVGVDSSTKKYIDELMKEIQIKEKERNEIKDQIDRLQKKLNWLAKEIGKLAQIQDRGTLEKRSLMKVQEELKTKNDLTKLTQMENHITLLEAKIKATEEPLTHLMDQQDQITENIFAFNQNMKGLEEKVEDLNQEIQAINERLKSEKGDPTIKVHHLILSGTKIKGPHSAMVLEENHEKVLIREKLITDLDAEGNPRPIWKMTFSKLT